jgi:hypothetical protein
MTYLRLILVAATVVPLTTVSGPAWGQGADDEPPDGEGWFDGDDPEPVPGDEPPAEEPPAVATEPPATEVSTPPPEVEPLSEKDKRRFLPPVIERPRPGRFRWGISPYFGAVKYDDEDSYLFQMGLEARFGGQLSDELAVYAVPSILGSESLRVATGFIIEGCFGDVVSLGGGLDAAVNTTDGWTEFQPGAGPTARVGLHIGKDKPARRKAFSLYAVSKVDFYLEGDHLLMFGGMLGYDGM